MSAKYISINKEKRDQSAVSFEQGFGQAGQVKRVTHLSKVKLRDLVGPNVIAFQIGLEAVDDFDRNVISSQSALANAVLGAHEGDIVGIQTKLGYRKFLVIEVA